MVSIPSTFKISEVMRGTHHFVDSSYGEAIDHLFYFRIDWAGQIPTTLNPMGDDFLTFDALGEIFVGGLTPGEVSCQGTLRVDYLISKSIRYELRFDHEGETYFFVGEKVDVDLLKPLFLVKTHTTCYGSITDADGHILSRSVTHFEPRTALPFLLSFRLE